MTNSRELIIQKMNDNNFVDALSLIEQSISNGEKDAGMYNMAGQCCRYTDDMINAVYYHKRAVDLNPKYPSFQLALGISYQLNGQFNLADEVLSSLISNNQEWDSLDVAFNSLALTQKKMGLLDKSKKNYNQSIKLFLFNIMTSLSNSKDNEIIKVKPTSFNLWFDYSVETASIFAQTFEDIDSISFPKSSNEKYKGLYWAIEIIDEKKTLLFLPNFFGVLRQYLKYDPGYFNTIGNISSVLEEDKDLLLSKKYLTEAREIMNEYKLNEI